MSVALRGFPTSQRRSTQRSGTGTKSIASSPLTQLGVHWDRSLAACRRDQMLHGNSDDHFGSDVCRSFRAKHAEKSECHSSLLRHAWPRFPNDSIPCLKSLRAFLKVSLPAYLTHQSCEKNLLYYIKRLGVYFLCSCPLCWNLLLMVEMFRNFDIRVCSDRDMSRLGRRSGLKIHNGSKYAFAVNVNLQNSLGYAIAKEKSFALLAYLTHPLDVGGTCEALAHFLRPS